MRDRLNENTAGDVAFPQSTIAFWEDIHEIADAAQNQVTKAGINLCSAHKAIRDQFPDIAARIGRIAAFASTLMNGKNALSRPRGDDGTKHQEWVNQCWSAVASDPPQPHLSDERVNAKLTEEKFRSEFAERADEIMMENLTATWLGLYFLGVPFIAPWENVLRIADERGGFPSGVCITKYVGDVYRAARLEMAGAAGKPATATAPYNQKDAPLWILSYQPSAMLRDLITCPEHDSRTPADLHRLGWCYLVLQLRLHLDQGFPINYFIPLHALKKSWEKLTQAQPANERTTTLNDITEWFLDIMFLHADREKQSVKLLVKPDATSGIPTCILGNEIGIYTLNNSQSHVHFGGNHIRDALLASYRLKLDRLRHRNIAECFTHPPDSTVDGYDLLKMNRMELKALLAYFLEGKTAGSQQLDT